MKLCHLLCSEINWPGVLPNVQQLLPQLLTCQLFQLCLQLHCVWLIGHLSSSLSWWHVQARARKNEESL